MLIKSIKDGYSCAGGLTQEGKWYAAIRMADNNDEKYTEPGEDRWKIALREQYGFADWMEQASLPRKLMWIEEGDRSAKLLSEAEMIFGPGSVKTDVPAGMATWCERKDETWHLMVKNEGSLLKLHSSHEKMAQPAGCLLNGMCYGAVCVEEEGTATIIIYREDGTRYFSTKGRRPILCPAHNNIYLLYEQVRNDKSGISLKLIKLHEGVKSGFILFERDDININGDILYDSKQNELIVTWESCPAWGFDEYIGRHRDINIWKVDSKFIAQPCEGTLHGKIDLPKTAFANWNMPPIFPKLLISKDKPALTYKCFRFRGKAATGWDVYLCTMNRSGWSGSMRISKNIGISDSDYTVVETSEGLIGLFPSCDNKMGATKAFNIRTEISKIPEKGYSQVSVPQKARGYYMIPPSITGIGKEPSPIFNAEDGLQLIWGDIHSHTNYSKCMCSINGSPDNWMRYLQDMMQYKVLTFTDHFHHMGAAEDFWLTDKLEELADKSSIVLYSCEPGVKPGEHTNFYTIDREVFDKLRIIVSSLWDRKEIYDTIRQYLPENSVIAVRHFHGFDGEFGIRSDETVTTWDPEIEKAMEAIQIRGNVLMGNLHKTEQWPEHLPAFPGNFLDAGAEIALVGGTDHRGFGQSNHFGMTGFWVEEPTAKGVWAAINKRMTVACSNGKMAIWTESKGQPMGSNIRLEKSESLNINVKISSAWPIRRVCLLKDCSPLEWIDVNDLYFDGVLSDENCLPGHHWYSVTVQGDSTFSGEIEKLDTQLNDHIMAHASPYYVFKDSQ